MKKITNEKIDAITKTLREAYAAEIDALTGRKPGGFTKRQAEDLKAGYDDGMRNMVIALRSQGIITITE